MRLVIQRVSEAAVHIDNQPYAAIGAGMLILLGIEGEDHEEDREWLIGKLSRLRIFDDQEGVMNLSIQDVSGEVMVVSQFTLHASTRKGNRPSYIRAAPPEVARLQYEAFVRRVQEVLGRPVATGRFGAMMQVQLINDGPVTILMDSKNRE